MNIKYVVDEALSLADEIGNEEEYREKIIRAVNHVQAKISKFAKQIKTYVNIQSIDKVITLPDDLLTLVSVEDTSGNFVAYKQVDVNKIEVNHEDNYRICYNKILPDFDVNAKDEEEILIEKIAEQCLVYGVAAEISMDNEDLYPILQNEYNNLLANLEIAVDIPSSGSSISHIEGMWY